MPSLCIFILNGTARLSLSPHPHRARQDAETLLLHLLGKDKAWLMTHGEEELTDAQADRFAAWLERRFRGEPIQYITGEAEFYGLSFRVTPGVLIPRPETEHLVEKVLALAAGFERLRIVDVGAGSGAIAVALARKLSQRAAQRPSFVTGHDFSRAEDTAIATRALAPEGGFSGSPSTVFSVPANRHRPFAVSAIDLSAAALDVARENAERNGVSARIRFLEGDLLAPVAEERFEIVVSNPPYVPEADRVSLSVEVRDYEPELALFAGDDGLAIYRRLIPAARAVLVSGGFVALEIGYGQEAAIRNLLADCGFDQIEIVPDLQGIPRVACARRPS